MDFSSPTRHLSLNYLVNRVGCASGAAADSSRSFQRFATDGAAAGGKNLLMASPSAAPPPPLFHPSPFPLFSYCVSRDERKEEAEKLNK